MRSIESSFYRSRAWETTRKLYLAQVNHLCERCKAEGKFTPARFVHHKIYLTEANYKDPEISLNFGNLEALCADHHNAEHFRKRRWKFVNGELVTNETDY